MTNVVTNYVVANELYCSSGAFEMNLKHSKKEKTIPFKLVQDKAKDANSNDENDDGVFELLTKSFHKHIKKSSQANQILFLSFEGLQR